MTLTQISTVRQWRQKLLEDLYRPAYHFVVPEGVCLSADPHSAVYWRGRYQLGYIFQDEAGQHCWRHASRLGGFKYVSNSNS